MNWRDIRPGAEVYHCICTHWGKGIVQRIVFEGYLYSQHTGSKKGVVVQFEIHDKPVMMQLNELRKTPNRKKIKAMVELYQKRGVDAQDGGDKLILPKGRY